MNVFMFYATLYFTAFALGKMLEKVRIPWVFSALLIGVLFSLVNPFKEITSSDLFEFLARLGMYFLLFMIGLEIDIRGLLKKTRFIFKATLFIILFEAFFGSIAIHYLFHYNWLISFLVSLSFATVGEAILVPILDEFNLVNTEFGQTIIGIGTLDDVIEIFTLVLTTFIISQSTSPLLIFSSIIFLLILFYLTYLLIKIGEKGKKFTFIKVSEILPFVFSIFFFFLGIGKYSEATPLASILAGICVKSLFPERRLEEIGEELKGICYGFLAPIFFFWVGIKMNLQYLLKNILLVLIIFSITTASKIISSIIACRKRFGIKKSALLGLGLSIRFSTSVIILKILFEHGVIGFDIYSVCIASTILLEFLIPMLFAKLSYRVLSNELSNGC